MVSATMCRWLRSLIVIAPTSSRAFPNNGISGHLANQLPVSQRVYGVWSHELAHHLARTCGNAASKETTEKKGWMSNFCLSVFPFCYPPFHRHVTFPPLHLSSNTPSTTWMMHHIDKHGGGGVIFLEAIVVEFCVLYLFNYLIGKLCP